MPTDTTAKLNLPLIAAAQAQKHITHNEALEALDTIVQLSVLDRDLATPPATPAEGDSYIVAAAATGDWAGHEGEIASFRNGGWVFHAPRPGWLAHVADENTFVFHDGTQWAELTSLITALQNLLRLGVNTTADDTNRLAVKSDAVLFSHDDTSGTGSGDMRLKFNKAASANTASLLFQSNWSGRAEIGLTGNDDLSIKVSADGATWQQAMVIDAATGVPLVPVEKLSIRGALPRLELQDRAGGWQSNITLEANPVLGGVRQWGHLGVCIQRYDQNATPPAPVGNSVGIGWGFNSVVPYFSDSYGRKSNLLTAINARVASYTVANLPSASVKGAGTIVFVSDEAGGPTLAFSDGSKWRRVQDRAIVS